MGMGSMTIATEALERQLDRIQSFIPRIDSRVSAIFAITSGQLAIAILNVGINDLKAWWIAIPCVTYVVMALSSIYNLYRCIHPNLLGGQNSLLYFGEIAKLREAEYIEKMSICTDETFRKDLTCQIWRNSEIVAEKYKYLRRASSTTMIALIPWIIILASVSLANWKLPVLQH